MLQLPALTLVLIVAGCAVNAPAERTISSPEPSPERGYSIHEDVELSAVLRQDFEQAVQLLQDGQYEQGIGLLNRVVSNPQAKGNSAPFIDLAIAYQKTGRLDLAEENLKKALMISPQHPVANNEYGMLLRKSGRFKEARAAYETALSKYPEFLPARKNLGILCDLYLADLECARRNYAIYSAAAADDKTVATWLVDVEKRMASK